jgi:hypothetical protein
VGITPNPARVDLSQVKVGPCIGRKVSVTYTVKVVVDFTPAKDFIEGFYIHPEYFSFEWWTSTGRSGSQKYPNLTLSFTERITKEFDAVPGSGVAFTYTVHVRVIGWTKWEKSVVAYYELYGTPVQEYPKAKIKVSVGEGSGSTTPSGVVELGYGSSVTITATPEKSKFVDCEFWRWRGSLIPRGATAENPITVSWKDLWDRAGCGLATTVFEVVADFYCKTYGVVRVVAYADGEPVAAACDCEKGTCYTPYEQKVPTGGYATWCRYAGQTKMGSVPSIKPGETAVLEFRFAKPPATPTPTPTKTPIYPTPTPTPWVPTPPPPIIPTPTKTPTPWAPTPRVPTPPVTPTPTPRVPTPWMPTPPTVAPPPTPIAVPAPTPTPTPAIYSLLPLVILGLGAGAMIYAVGKRS